MAIVAPPSDPAVVKSAGAQLAAGLAQAQTDAATLQQLLAAWPADLPTDLQPVVQILERVVNDLALVANASASIARHVGLTL